MQLTTLILPQACLLTSQRRLLTANTHLQQSVALLDLEDMATIVR